jgi:hypothetical protein
MNHLLNNNGNGSNSLSSFSNTTVKRMADIVKPGSKPTFVTQSQINSGRY